MLCKVLLSQQPDRYKKAQAFIGVQNLPPEAVAQIVSAAVVQGLLADGQEKEPGETGPPLQEVLTLSALSPT